MNVVTLVGSLRADSHNRQLAQAAAALLPAGSHVTNADFSALPFYSEELDVEGKTPDSVQALRQQLAAADAVIIATPEYNGSLPGGLKNAIDWASRPYGRGALAGTPALVLGASMSPYAAQWARGDAVRALGVAGAKPLETTVGLGSSHEAFGEGKTLPAETLAALQSAVADLLAATAQKEAAIA